MGAGARLLWAAAAQAARAAPGTHPAPGPQRRCWMSAKLVRTQQKHNAWCLNCRVRTDSRRCCSLLFVRALAPDPRKEVMRTTRTARGPPRARPRALTRRPLRRDRCAFARRTSPPRDRARPFWGPNRIVSRQQITASWRPFWGPSAGGAAAGLSSRCAAGALSTPPHLRGTNRTHISPLPRKNRTHISLFGRSRLLFTLPCASHGSQLLSLNASLSLFWSQLLSLNASLSLSFGAGALPRAARVLDAAPCCGRGARRAPALSRR